MPGKVSLKTVGNWPKEIGNPLKTALATSMEVCGRTGEQACRHALILMAQSAGKLARPNRRTTRRVQNDKDRQGSYVNVYVQGRKKPYKVYKWMFAANSDTGRIKGDWANARKIGAAGLAQRSWMWGLSRLGAKSVSKSIGGKSRVRTITTEKVSGYIKENRLEYVPKVMPRGWELTVQKLAGDKIMGQAKRKTEKRFKAAIRRQQRGQVRTAQNVSRFFLKGLA